MLQKMQAKMIESYNKIQPKNIDWKLQIIQAKQIIENYQSSIDIIIEILPRY